ncbi:MAG: Na+/H+ antiporter NhaA, partial [Actinomycetota bacterium]
MPRSIAPLRDFLHRESSSGVLLLVAALAGLAVANSPWSGTYFSALSASFELGSDSIYLKLTTLKVINYALMTIFFFVVGLEIKRELTSGHLSSFRSAIMPFFGAVGGMLIPAGIYLLIAGREAPSGWGVPVATDIALAVGLLGALGTAVVPPLRTFLLGLAVIDDIGAILIIAFIYSTGVEMSWFLFSTFAVIAIVAIKKFGVTNTAAYVVVGVFLWYGLYRSGVHATLAGVILGLLTPNQAKVNPNLRDEVDGSVSVIEWLEAKLHPWSSFVIIPIFAFANTGVVITSSSLVSVLNSPVAWGIFAGLVLGKPLGIVLALVLAKKSNVGDYPKGAHIGQIAATGSAAGIGFTVAIFIANLAFDEKALQDTAVLAVIGASVTSGLISWLLF